MLALELQFFPVHGKFVSEMCFGPQKSELPYGLMAKNTAPY